jgi:peptide/nickel transport system permease protein
MITYITRRLLWAVPTVIVISLLCFTVVNLPAGDVASEYALQLQMSEGYTEADAKHAADLLRKQYGLDKPVPLQYLVWLGGFVTGDYGVSLLTYNPVADLIWERLGYTIFFASASLVFAWTVGVTVGIYSATHQYSLMDNIATFAAFLGRSIPGFLLALFILVTVVLRFNLELPIGLMSERYLDEPFSMPKLLNILWHIWIPIVVGGTAAAAGLLRLMRGSLLDEMGREYVETARAKGLPERVVIHKHALRVAINPLISVLGIQFPVLLSGGVITSIVLGLPTLGPLLFSSLVRQDAYVASAILMFMGMLLVVGNFVSDILLAWVDPRIRLG